MAANVVCPHCGSKNTEERNGYLYCNDCTSDFGRDKQTDDGQDMVDALIGLRFSYGDMATGSTRLRFAWDKTGKTCVYEVYQSKDGKLNKFADTVDEAEWNRMKDVLVNSLYVCDWDREYYPVNDGRPFEPDHEWRLDLIIEDEDERTYRGVDNYPPYFTRMLTRFKKYFAKLEEN